MQNDRPLACLIMPSIPWRCSAVQSTPRLVPSIRASRSVTSSDVLCPPEEPPPLPAAGGCTSDSVSDFSILTETSRVALVRAACNQQTNKRIDEETFCKSQLQKALTMYEVRDNLLLRSAAGREECLLCDVTPDLSYQHRGSSRKRAKKIHGMGGAGGKGPPASRCDNHKRLQDMMGIIGGSAISHHEKLCMSTGHYFFFGSSHLLFSLFFLLSLALPRHNSDPGSLNRLFFPLPHYGTCLHFYSDNTSALSFLVDSHRITEVKNTASSKVTGVCGAKAGGSSPRRSPPGNHGIIRVNIYFQVARAVRCADDRGPAAIIPQQNCF